MFSALGAAAAWRGEAKNFTGHSGSNKPDPGAAGGSLPYAGLGSARHLW
jgi:hypothetical protein